MEGDGASTMSLNRLVMARREELLSLTGVPCCAWRGVQVAEAKAHKSAHDRKRAGKTSAHSVDHHAGGTEQAVHRMPKRAGSNAK